MPALVASKPGRRSISLHACEALRSVTAAAGVEHVLLALRRHARNEATTVPDLATGRDVRLTFVETPHPRR